MCLLNGEDTYNAIANALETPYTPNANGDAPKSPGIYLCNWIINFDFNLKRVGGKGVPGTMLKDYLDTASQNHDPCPI